MNGTSYWSSCHNRYSNSQTYDPSTTGGINTTSHSDNLDKPKGERKSTTTTCSSSSTNCIPNTLGFDSMSSPR